jgi:hypothetical protein
MGLPEKDSNMKKESSASESHGGVYKEDVSSTTYSIALQEHYTLRSLSEIKQAIVIEKALETSSLSFSGVITPSATSTTNLSLLS